ncbi:hypothetical protein KVR01_000409 [Diaporthe batatas]|uniref:uncharacterized protein n=1 Tax=Diaporthe batatas TaxID=748121 RepID=UPI001D04D0B4|nr:uncharacterized protein KVR01_000409 [Diaporthe batatas]KAG8169664.1 hypothetical protein KVR01_000409 [Diaporthe batatas]
MHATAALLTLLPAAAMAWDQKLCNGVGGCQGLTWISDFGYTCPSGAQIGMQATAHALLEIAQGSYEYVASDEFPASCERSADIPGPSETTHLVKHTVTEGSGKGLTFYGYITDKCTEKVVATPGDCYLSNPNPSPFTQCRVTEKDDKTFCTQDPALNLGP